MNERTLREAMRRRGLDYDTCQPIRTNSKGSSVSNHETCERCGCGESPSSRYQSTLSPEQLERRLSVALRETLSAPSTDRRTSSFSRLVGGIVRLATRSTQRISDDVTVLYPELTAHTEDSTSR